ncbi:MAG: HAD family hydrolase, partial [Desulfurispora sp.]|uniref:HAD family hydrolase n=1 Tax=Desulfurispora sp. TaxID=3014275 RepID=UPI00404B1993
QARELGRAVGLVSNIWPPYYASFCTAWPDVEQQMDAIALSFRVGAAKPDPRLYQHALAQLGLPPAQVCMVGDTYYNDILPAIQLGLRTVWVLCRPDKEAAALRAVEQGRLPAPDLVVPDLSRLDLAVLFRANAR